jgi:hypothetical protein
MSKTDRDGEVSDRRTDRPGSEERSSRQLQSLYRADLRPFEPVSDAQILAAIHRAEVHDQHDHASRSDIAAHLGFAHNSWTTRRLRPQLAALRSAGHIRDVRRYGLDLLALTDTGRRALAKARSTGEVILPESPQHRKWRHSRTLAGERIDGFRLALQVSLAEAGVLLDTERAPSTAWVEFAKRLSRDCKRLVSATYCQFEWPEPDDERADVDDEIKGRRNVWDWDSDHHGY